VNAVTRADLNHPAVVEGGGVDEYSLWMSAGDHGFQVIEEQARIEVIACRDLGEQLAIRFCDAYDLNLRSGPSVIEEVAYVSVDHSHNSDAKRGLSRRGLSVSKRSGKEGYEKNGLGKSGHGLLEKSGQRIRTTW
jgi:hypothetical protein